jgi:hypothetical protein
MKNLLYLSYGSGPHVDELAFSVLSACRFIPPSRTDYRIIVAADDPAPYKDLRVTIDLITPTELGDWLGPNRFGHRCKIFALRRALMQYNAPTIIVDGDSWFRRSPDVLFEWLAPGRSIMHMDEGPLKHLQEHRFISDRLAKSPFSPPSRPGFTLTPNLRLWNAGIAGLHPANVGLLDRVAALSDEIWDWQPNDFAEQMAFSAILGAETQRREAADVIFHYWRPYLRNPFRETLATLMPQSRDLPAAERIEKCWPKRPRPGLLKQIKCGIKGTIHQFGYTRVGLRSNG